MMQTISPELARQRAVLWTHNVLAKQILEVGTSQIPKHTAEALGMNPQARESAPLWNVLSYEPWAEFGWILWTTERDPLPEPFTQQHSELAALLKFAAGEGFQYLKLDCDADCLPKELGFPVFEW